MGWSLLLVSAHAAAAAPCGEWSRVLPNVPPALCEAAALQAGEGRSVLGRAIYLRNLVPPGLAERPRRRVLVVGGLHGDELSSVSLVLHWIAWAPAASHDLEWRFVPLMNPDGALRKRPTRVNARGVDLNRNFPTTGWERQAHRHWSDQHGRDPRRYPGPAPLSEPESRWLHGQMESWQPDLIVSVHAPYGVLDFDGPSRAPDRLGRLQLSQIGIFPGSLGNYGGLQNGVPVVTIELPSALRTPGAEDMRRMWQDLLKWIDERVPARTAGAPPGAPGAAGPALEAAAPN